MEVFGEDEE